MEGKERKEERNSPFNPVLGLDLVSSSFSAKFDTVSTFELAIPIFRQTKSSSFYPDLKFML
jgi:hypothetical protein